MGTPSGLKILVCVLVISGGTFANKALANCEAPLKVNWQEMGRLAGLEKLLGPNDSAAIRLTFIGPYSAFKFARQKLQEHHAHFIMSGLSEYHSTRPLLNALGIDTRITGRLYLRITNVELKALRPYIELADDFELEPAVGLENEHKILKGNRKAIEKFDPQEREQWQEIMKQPDKTAYVQTVTSYDRERFQELANKIAGMNKLVQIFHTYYNSAQSVGYLILEGKAKDLNSVIENFNDIHLVQLKMFLHPPPIAVNDSEDKTGPR